MLALTFCVHVQTPGETAAEWRDYRAVSGGTPRAGGGEGASRRGLHVFRVATSLHHRYPVGPGLLHLVRIRCNLGVAIVSMVNEPHPFTPERNLS